MLIQASKLKLRLYFGIFFDSKELRLHLVQEIPESGFYKMIF